MFTCPDKHFPRKVVYPDGKREWIFPQKRCEKCGYKLDSGTEEKDNLLIFTDTCTGCGNSSILELEYPIPDPPINEEERKKYCIAFIGRSTIAQSLAKIDNLKHLQWSIPEEGKKEESEIPQIEKVKVLKLEERLKEIVEKNGFLKFQFEKTKIDKYVIVEFSVQDNSDREEKDCIKVIKKVLQTELFMTNWRLVDSEINYGLGLITGKLRGAQDEESILKIAQEVKNKTSKK